jgi:hypothetical protein
MTSNMRLRKSLTLVVATKSSNTTLSGLETFSLPGNQRNIFNIPPLLLGNFMNNIPTSLVLLVFQTPSPIQTQTLDSLSWKGFQVLLVVPLHLAPRFPFPSLFCSLRFAGAHSSKRGGYCHEPLSSHLLFRCDLPFYGMHAFVIAIGMDIVPSSFV